MDVRAIYINAAKIKFKMSTLLKSLFFNRKKKKKITEKYGRVNNYTRVK